LIILKPKISLLVPFYSTEDKSKLELAIKNLLDYLPNLKQKSIDNIRHLSADNIKLESLKHFYMHIRQNEILDTVRRYANINAEEGQIVFTIHKQALTVNKIAVVSEDASSALGDIKLKIYTKEVEKFLDWFAPETEKGKIIKSGKFKDIFNF